MHQPPISQQQGNEQQRCLVAGQPREPPIVANLMEVMTAIPVGESFNEFIVRRQAVLSQPIATAVYIEGFVPGEVLDEMRMLTVRRVTMVIAFIFLIATFALSKTGNDRLAKVCFGFFSPRSSDASSLAGGSMRSMKHVVSGVHHYQKMLGFFSVVAGFISVLCQ